MKRSVLLAAIATCAMLGAVQVQAKPVFMKYDGVKGESQKAKAQRAKSPKTGRVNVAAGDVNGDGLPRRAASRDHEHKDWIPVESAQARRGGGAGTGKASNQDIKAPTEQAGLLVPAVQKVRD